MGQLAPGAGHGPGAAHKGKLNRRFHFFSSQSHIYQKSLTQPRSLGNKKDNITVIYTPWANLKKDGSMDVGQVSFHDQKKAGILPSLLALPQSENGEDSSSSFNQSNCEATQTGQAYPRPQSREPHCQPPQQDQGGEEA